MNESNDSSKQARAVRAAVLDVLRAKGVLAKEAERLGLPRRLGFEVDVRLGRRGRRGWRGQVHLPSRPGSTGENYPIPLGVQAERLPADLAGQVERRPRHTLPRQVQGVTRHPLPQRL